MGLDWNMTMVLLSALAPPYALVLASPGPNLLVVLRAGLVRSVSRPLAAAAGVALGAAAATGIAALGATMLLPIQNIELIGTLVFSAILIRTALRLHRGAIGGGSENSAAAGRGAGRLFWLGFVTALCNPVTISFFLGFFIAHPALQCALPLSCAVVFSMAAVWFAIIGLIFAHSAGGLSSGRGGQVLRRTLALLMVAVAVSALWRIVPPLSSDGAAKSQILSENGLID